MDSVGDVDEVRRIANVKSRMVSDGDVEGFLEDARRDLSFSFSTGDFEVDRFVARDYSGSGKLLRVFELYDKVVDVDGVFVKVNDEELDAGDFDVVDGYKVEVNSGLSFGDVVEVGYLPLVWKSFVEVSAALNVCESLALKNQVDGLRKRLGGLRKALENKPRGMGVDVGLDVGLGVNRFG